MVEAQDTAVVYGMPKAVIEKGIADEVHGLATLRLRLKTFIDE